MFDLRLGSPTDCGICAEVRHNYSAIDPIVADNGSWCSAGVAEPLERAPLFPLCRSPCPAPHFR
jgi:hypothetical protein